MQPADQLIHPKIGLETTNLPHNFFRVADDETITAQRGGIRLEGGVTSNQALMWNRRTCRSDAKGQGRGGDTPEAQMRSTGAE